MPSLTAPANRKPSCSAAWWTMSRLFRRILRGLDFGGVAQAGCPGTGPGGRRGPPAVIPRAGQRNCSRPAGCLCRAGTEVAQTPLRGPDALCHRRVNPLLATEFPLRPSGRFIFSSFPLPAPHGAELRDYPLMWPDSGQFFPFHFSPFPGGPGGPGDTTVEEKERGFHEQPHGKVGDGAVPLERKPYPRFPGGG